MRELMAINSCGSYGSCQVLDWDFALRELMANSPDAPLVNPDGYRSGSHRSSSRRWAFLLVCVPWAHAQECMCVESFLYVCV
jgi:hypothetical protein